MTNGIADISLRQAAKVAGLSRLISVIPVIFGSFFVFPSLLVAGDAAATANNIMANELLFRMGIFTWPLVFVLDLLMAWALYILLKPVNKSLSLLTAWFSLIHVAIAGSALVNYFAVLQFLSGADYLAVFGADQLQALVLPFLSGYDAGFNIGIFFFSFHLLVLGYLVFKSGYIPRILGILLIIASLGYLIESIAIILIPNFDVPIATFTFIGELVFPIWLLWKGAKIPEMES